MADTKIASLSAGTAASTDRWPIAVSPYAAGNNAYLTHDLLGTYFGKNLFAGGTITTSQPHGLTQTWNAGAVTFTGLKINVTDTASTAASLLADFQVAGTSKLNIDKNGAISIANGAFILDYGITTAATLTFTTVSGNMSTGGNGLNIGGLFQVKAQTGYSIVHQSFGLQWGSNGLLTPDTGIARNAAGVIEINTGLTVAGGGAYAPIKISVLQLSVAPTVIAGAGPFLVGSGTTLNSRIKVTANGVDYWVPCSTTAF